MPSFALPSRVVMEQPGPPAYSAWSRSGYNSYDNRSAETLQMGRSMPDRRIFQGSTTSWTSVGSEADDPYISSFDKAMELPRQTLLLEEYNRLARKRGLRPIRYPDDEGYRDDLTENDSQVGERRNWFARAFGKSSAPVSRRSSRHRRSDSDPANPSSSGPYSSKSDVADTLKSQSLKTLVRICGKSFLYLPSEYATRSLMLPTCFRAAAQYLVLHAPETRGIFRVSGSTRVVNELYDYYCINLDDDEDIAATVRSPNLPFHIKASVHDVASMFKRLLAGLPGGIIGNLRLFEALVEIRKMDGHASYEVFESRKSDPTHIKARLIALAIGSSPNLLHRELMCCVFGLLSLIGHAAETAGPAQATYGSSLPHSEMMGYAALGIIFGPLLMGNLLDSFSPDTAASEYSVPGSPSAGPSFQSTPSPQLKSDKRRKSMAPEKHKLAALPSTLDKILLANDVAEMLISGWRTIVHEMRHMGIMRTESMLQHPHQHRSSQPLPRSRSLRPSKSETFTDHDVGAMVQQISQLHSSDLRQTRSASNTQIPSTTTSSHLLPPSMPTLSQRLSDISFGDFTARGKIRNYTSNISIASDSTYSAIEPQPVKPLSPPAEDPFYIPGSIAISTRSGAAKLTKQRRASGGASGGLSSMFGGDRPPVPPKDLPNTSKKAVTSHMDTRPWGFREFQDTAKAVSPWNVSLNHTKPRSGNKNHVDDGLYAFGPSPTKKTPVREQHRSDPPYSCKSEPAGRVSTKNTPQSKTAALIAKIMNPKPTAAETSPTKATDDLPSYRDRVPQSFNDAPRVLDYQFSSSVSASPTKTADQWTQRRYAAPVFTSENRAAEPLAIVSPTPQRPWKVRGSPLVSGKSPAPSAMARSSPPNTQTTTTTSFGTSSGIEKQSFLLPSPTKDEKTYLTTQKTTHDGSPVIGSARDRVAGLKSEQKPLRAASQERYDAYRSPNSTVSPLSEIKNDARVLTRRKSTSFQSSKKFQIDSVDKPSAKSPPVGSSVKAMAAMFDTAAWKTTFDPSSPANTMPATAKPQTPKRSSGLSQYPDLSSQSVPSSKRAEPLPITPRSSLPPFQNALGVFESRNADSLSNQQMASERRRLRLTKSEGRNGPLGKAGHLAPGERREAARSVDRSEVRNDLPWTWRSTLGSPGTQFVGKWGKITQGQNQTAFSHFKDKSGSSLLPLRRSASAKELRQLLDSKNAECEDWKKRADTAEKRVAELEIALALTSVSGSGSGGSVSGRSSLLGSFDDRKYGLATTVAERRNDQTWAWQNSLPDTKSIYLTPEKYGLSSVVREIGVTGSGSTDRGVSRLRKGFEPDKSEGNSRVYGGYSPNATVVMRGKLMDKQLSPFSL